MPTRKDKTNVAPIYREQVFIPASGTTLMKQKSRPKVAGRPVSSGAVEIVSPEFDLLTGIRGIANLPKAFLKTNKLPQGENLYYRQLDKSSKGLERAKQVGVIDTKSSGGANFTTSRGTTLRIGKTFDTPFFAKGSLWYNNVDDMDVIVGKDNPLLDWKMITQHGRVTENAIKAANRRTPFYNGATNQAPTELFELYRRYPGIGYRNVTYGFPTIPVTGLNTVAEQMKCGGRRKAKLGLDIREGGIAIPIANNMFYIDGRKHAAGGVAIGPNNKNGVEVEGGEVVEIIDSNHPSVGRQFKAGGQQQTMRVFSSVPFLRGVSPAQLVIQGANPNKVFKAQEEFKDRNRINDDGTTYENGGKIAIEGAKTIGGYLPFIGTALDAYELYKNPSWKQAGWTTLGLLSDIFTGGSTRAVIKTARNLKNAKEALSIVRGPITKRIYKDAAVNAIKANTKARKNVIRDATFNVGQNYTQHMTDKYEMGGEEKPKSKYSRPVTGILPYGYTIRNLYAVENPYRKGIKGNTAKMYDSRTLGAGVDVVSGHPELYKKAKSGKMTKKQADETAVIHLRKDDNAIRSNYADVYGKAAADTLSYGPRFLVAQARYQQGNVRKAWPAIHKAMAKGNAKALKKAVLQVTPKDHAYRRKWIEDFKVYKFGGNMIYTINGNVKNGLMNVRPKAQYGLANKYLKKKNVSNEETPKPVSDNKKQNYDFENNVKTTLGIIGGLTAAEAIDYNLGRLKNYFNSAIEPSLEISQEALDKYNENYVRKTQGKTNKGFTPRNPLKSSNNIQYQRLDINEHNIGLYDSKDPIVRATIKARGLNPDRVTANGSFVRRNSNLTEVEQRKLDKVYNKAVGNKEPKSGFGAKPADKVITAEYPNTSISSKPTNVVGKTYDPTAEFRQANKPKPTVNTGLNNYLRKLGKGVKGLGVVGSLLDIYNNLFPSEEAELLEDLRIRMKEQSTPGTRMYKYGGRAKADYGKFLRYKNGIFTDPETGEEYDVDPEVFKMYGNSFEEGVIPMNDYTKGTFDNARPQYYAEKRLPLFGNKSIAEKAGLTRSGWSYSDGPTLDYVPKINISVPTNRVKVIGDNAKTSTSSTPRRGESKSAVTTESKSNIAAKSKTEPVYINYTPNKISLAVEADNPTSRTLTKIDSSPTGGGIQSKDGNWIPQYNLITGRDWLGVGANLAGHIASYFANKDILDKYPMPVKPVMAPAVKLKTRVNINPELTSSKEAELMGIEATNRNTSSSNTALARNQRIMNESRDARNKLYAYKENAETRLINQDRLNRQGIYAKNVAAYNDWLNKTFVAKTNKLLGKQQNLMNLINGIPMAVNNVLGNIETRKSTNDMIRAIAAANPNVDGRLFGIGDYYTQRLADGRTAVYNKKHKLIKYE